LSPPSVSKGNSHHHFNQQQQQQQHIRTNSSINGWRKPAASKARTSLNDTFPNSFSEPFSETRKKLGRSAERGKVENTFSPGESQIGGCHAAGGGGDSGSGSRARKPSCLDDERTPEWIWKLFQMAKHGLPDLVNNLFLSFLLILVLKLRVAG
jgi:hypothetical protein